MSSDDDGQTQQPDRTWLEQEASPSPKPSPGVRGSTTPPMGARNRQRGLVLGAGLAVVIALVTTVGLLSGGSTPSQSGPTIDVVLDAPSDDIQIIDPMDVTAEQLAKLPQSTTSGTIPNAPTDPAPSAHTSGRIVRPSATIPVFSEPGGPAIAALPARQTFGELTTDTAVPVVAEEPGWAQVLLPSRPNSSTGWIYLDDSIITEHSQFRIVVDRARFSLALVQNDTEIGRWTIGVGKAHAVTPAGRTFILSSILDTNPNSFSPIVMPLGSHSDTFATYGGGPGTVGIHTWPTPDVFGRASSDGCVRVPRNALDVISTTPLGSVVEIT